MEISSTVLWCIAFLHLWSAWFLYRNCCVSVMMYDKVLDMELKSGPDKYIEHFHNSSTNTQRKLLEIEQLLKNWNVSLDEQRKTLNDIYGVASQVKVFQQDNVHNQLVRIETAREKQHERYLEVWGKIKGATDRCELFMRDIDRDFKDAMRELSYDQELRDNVARELKSMKNVVVWISGRLTNHSTEDDTSLLVEKAKDEFLWKPSDETDVTCYDEQEPEEPKRFTPPAGYLTVTELLECPEVHLEEHQIRYHVQRSKVNGLDQHVLRRGRYYWIHKDGFLKWHSGYSGA